VIRSAETNKRSFISPLYRTTITCSQHFNFTSYVTKIRTWKLQMIMSWNYRHMVVNAKQDDTICIKNWTQNQLNLSICDQQPINDTNSSAVNNWTKITATISRCKRQQLRMPKWWYSQLSRNNMGIVHVTSELKYKYAKTNLGWRNMLRNVNTDEKHGW